ncbi:MAG: hypothetical protein NC310_04955 [Roseburia sp.]|nr:hypothetical protein [Anaeroplasma bactoclasticum]MCM1196409.1 hypothetical protein [Roseburia sp.]
MKLLNKLLKHKKFIGIISLALSISVLTGVLIAKNQAHIQTLDNTFVDVDTVADAGDNTSSGVSVEEEYEIKPYLEYTSLTANLNAGVSIYLEQTTVKDLKKNLTVVGSFQGATSTVELMPEEYSVALKIGAVTQNYDENDILFEEEPTEAFSVVIQLENSEVTAEVSIPLTSIKPLDDYHEYYQVITGITVDPIMTITNDYDARALEKLIVVKGIVGTSSVNIFNKESIKVTRLSPLEVGHSASFDVSFTYTTQEGTPIVYEVKNISIQSVTQAELIAADFKVNPEYRQNGMYYQKKVIDEDGSEKWFSGFVSSTAVANGTSIPEIYGQALVLTAYYPHSARIVNLDTIGNESATASTGEYVLFNTTTFVENTNTISATIRSNITSSVAIQTNINVNFEAAKIVEIKATNHNESYNGDINSSLPVNKAWFIDENNNSYIFTRSNTGEWSTQPLSQGLFKVSGKLNPSAQDLVDYNSSADKTNFIYHKLITIEYTNDSTVTSKYSLPVNYMEISSITTIGANGGYPEQTSLMPFNYDGIYITFNYENGAEVQALLSDYLDENGDSDHIELTLYNDSALKNPIKNEDGSYSKIMTQNVNAVKIRFRYDITTENYSPQRILSKSLFNLTINKYPVPLPEFNTNEVSFTSDVSKEIKFDSNLPESIIKGLTLKVYEDENHEILTENAIYNDGSANGLNQVEKIEFLAGGITYYIRLSISSDLSNEVEWGWGDDKVNADFEVSIKRGPITPIVVKYETGQWAYGDTPETPMVYGTKLNGEQIKIVKDGSTSFDTLVADYSIEFYHKDTRTLVAPGEKLVVGEYYVVIRVPQTDNYEAASSAEAGYFAPTIEITPAILSPDNLLNDITFDGAAHKGTDFVTANAATGIKYGETGIVKVDNLKSETSNVALVDGDAMHAGTYSIVLSLTDNKNYIWDAETEGYDKTTNTVTKEFKILKRNLALQISNSNDLDFIYGDVSNARQTPILEYCKDYVGGTSTFENVKPSYFFANVAPAKIYLLKDGTETLITESDYKKWVAGTYKVVYETTLAEGHLVGDYSLPKAEATFEINKQQITKIEDASLTGAYISQALEFSIPNFTNAKDNQNNSIYTWTLSGLEFDENGQITENEILTIADSLASDGKLPVGTSVIAANSKVSVTHAGVYTLIITLNDNYFWPTAEGETPKNQATITITISQKVIQGSLNSNAHPSQDVFTFDKNIFEYQPTGDQLTPTITMCGIGTKDGLALSTTLHQVGKDSIEIVDKSKMVADSYYYKLISWEADASIEGYDLAKNYQFPTDIKIVTFTIDSADLAEVVFTGELTTIYNGDNFDFRNYIDKYKETFTYGEDVDNTSKLSFYISSVSTNKGDLLNDVYKIPNMRDTGSYKVYIYPGDNFKWGEDVTTTTFGSDAPSAVLGKEGYVADFVINPKKLTASDVDWGTTMFTYNGKSQLPQPTIFATSLYDGDVSFVKLATVNVKTGDSTNHGTYTAQLNGFSQTSTRAFNYTIDAALKDITIQQAVLKMPLWNGTKTAKFTGGNLEANITLATPTTSVEGFVFKNSVSATITGGWINEEERIADGNHGAQFDLENGKFTYFNAGYYAITFNITDDNYVWEDNKENILITDIIVNRMQITAPALAKERTLEYDGDPKTPSFANKTILIDNKSYPINASGDSVTLPNGHTISWEVFYAAYASSFIDLSSSEDGLTDYGKYYVQLKIQQTDKSHLNYEWLRNGSDTDGIPILEEANYTWGTTKSNSSEGVSIFLGYMITKQIFDVTITTEAQSYVFGSNSELILNNPLIQATTFEQEGNFIHFVQSHDYDFVQGVAHSITFELYSVATLDSVRTDATSKKLDEADLVNGLPWNTGYYGAYVLLYFNEESQYEDIPSWITFEVTAKPIEVKWESTEETVTGSGTEFTTVYDGKEHTLQASINNAVDKKTVGDADIPNLKVSCAKTVLDASNEAYQFTVSIDYSSTIFENYTITNGTYTQAQLYINKLEISLKGLDLEDTFEYGKEINLDDKAWWGYLDGSNELVEGADAKKIITYNFSKDGSLVSGTLGVDTYELVVTLTTEGQRNYTLVSTQNGSFSVSPREITLQYNSDSAFDEYSQTTILGTPYKILYEGVESNDWLISGDQIENIFSLILKDNETDVTNIEYNPVKNTYLLYVVKGSDENYSVKVGSEFLTSENPEAELGSFEIKNAELTVSGLKGNVDASQELVYKANEYPWISTNSLESLISYEQIQIVNATENNLKWFISEDNSTWKEITQLKQVDCLEGEYYVKATADNHKDYNFDSTVNVKISQATIKIGLNYIGSNAIYYGAPKPSLTMADLTTSIFTFTTLLGDDVNKISDIFTGSITYTTSYEQWNDSNQEGYLVELDTTSLKADNYIIESENGILVVNPLPIAISMTSQKTNYSQTEEYLDEVLKGKDFDLLYNYVTIICLENGITIRDEKNQIISIHTNALKVEEGKIIATNDVAKYPFYLTAGDNFSNYEVSYIYVEGESILNHEQALGGEAAVFEIQRVENAFVSAFGFNGVDPLTAEYENLVLAWIYGMNDDVVLDGYDPDDKHQVVLPVSRFNSVPNSDLLNTTIIYKISYKNSSLEEWTELGTDSDIVSLIQSLISAGKFNAGDYKVEYSLEGNGNYDTVSDVRYFKVNPRTLYVWATDAQTYYGEDFIRNVDSFGLVDNGSGTKDTLQEVLNVSYAYDYKADHANKEYSNAGEYVYTIEKDSEATKFDNYVVILNKESAEQDRHGTIEVLPRPVVIDIKNLTSQYDFNKAFNETHVAEELVFSASFGVNALNIELHSNNPFLNVVKKTYDNTNGIINLVTNVFSNGDSSIATQNVGNYPIYAVYTNETAKNNYAITVSTTYTKDASTEVLVENFFPAISNFYQTFVTEYFASLDEDLRIGDETLAGTYTITPANLRITLSVPTNATYDGQVKEAKITSEYDNDSSYSTVSYHAEYLYDDQYDVNAPVNVGKYPVRIVVDNPNYIFNAGGTSFAVTIVRRVLDWTVCINDGDNLAESKAYNSTYLAANTNNKFVLNFTNIVENCLTNEKLSFVNTALGSKLSDSKIDLGQAPYSIDYMKYGYEDSVFTLTALNAGIYTIKLVLTGDEAHNYEFPNAYASNDGSYEFSFTINRAKRNGTNSVSAVSTTVEYASPITADGSITSRFAGFVLDTNTLALVDEENASLNGSCSIASVRYSVADYNASTTQAREQLHILPSDVRSYNYDFDYSDQGMLTVLPRKINVAVHGASANNPSARVVYTGLPQGPDYEAFASDFFKPLAPEDGTRWYGEATADLSRNLSAIFNVRLNLYSDGSYGVTNGLGKNARTYYMNIILGNILSNYDIQFENHNGTKLDVYATSGYSIDTEVQPSFEIYKASLKVQAGSNGMNGDEAFNTNFNVTYGNKIEDEEQYYYLTATYIGFVNGESIADAQMLEGSKLTFTTKLKSGNGSAVYTPWDSHAGAVYEVIPGGLVFANYVIDDSSWLSGELVVIPRLVSASTADRTYAEEVSGGVINYYGGEQGRYHEAQIVFKDYGNAINNPANYYTLSESGEVKKDEYGVILPETIWTYAPKYSLSYVDLNHIHSNVNASGPQWAGEYEVTISMKAVNGNYDYLVVPANTTAGNSKDTLKYNIHKKTISIEWNEVPEGYLQYESGQDKQRQINDYISAIMGLPRITRAYNNGFGQEKVDVFTSTTGTLGDGEYAVGAGGFGLAVKIYGIGLYSATITIRDSAYANYEWLDSNTSEYTIIFRVAADHIEIESLTLGSWIYRESAKDIEYKTTPQVGLLYYYARLNSLPTGFDASQFGSMITDKDVLDYIDDNRGGYSQTIPDTVGTYVLRAYYPGSDQLTEAAAYLVFEITKAKLETPKILIEGLEVDQETGVLEMKYTGETLRLELGYDSRLLNIEYSNLAFATPITNGMAVLATDVVEGGYTISFSLVDNDNYSLESGLTNSFVWKIVPADDNEITSFDPSDLANLTYGDAYADPLATSTYSDNVIIQYFVDDEWVEEKPSMAGTYKVRALSPATTNYFAGSEGIAAISEEIEFTIERKELVATATGSITYGDAFSVVGGAGYSFSFQGFISTDDESSVTVSQVKYELIDNPTKLEVGEEYFIQLVEENGEVYGLTSDNYRIVASAGDFVVNKRNITLVLGDASSTYGELVDLTQVDKRIVYGELVDGDTLDDLNIQLNVEDNRLDLTSKYNSATSYKVNADADAYATSKNYNVSVFGSGVYTIRPLSIYITVEAGGGVYQGVIARVSLTGVYATVDDRDILAEFDSEHTPKIRFNYWGSSNDGNWVHTNEEMWSSEPSLAGNYHATAVSTQTNDFTLVTNMGTPSVSFVVEKKVLDDTNREVLFANPMEYTGDIVIPVVTDYSFEGLYNTGATNFENVGSYTIPLTLRDSANYKWASVDGATCEIPFEIVRGYNSFESEVKIQDWVYGAYDVSKNLPSADIKFGTSNDFTYTYSNQENGNYTSTLPTNAGTYWVKISAPQTDNYYSVTSSAQEFHILKASISSPTIVLVNDGDNPNTIYTGSRLQAEIQGYNSSTMRMLYDGDSSLGNTVSVYGLNANTYVVKFVLNDSLNYTWEEGTTLDNGDAIIYWNVARKQIAKPTMNTSMFMVNGGTLTFIPVGFDEETMNIEGNKTTYGGSFKVTVTLKDPTNFEWSDSSVDSVVFDWFVVGWDTVFIIVVSVIGIIAGVAAIAILVQYLLHRRKKKKELEEELAADALLNENLDLEAQTEEEAKNQEQNQTEPVDGGTDHE